MTLEPFRSKLLLNSTSSLIPQLFVCYFGHLCACGRLSVVSRPIDSGKHQEALSLLMYLDQPCLAESNMIHLQFQGNFLSLPDAGESGRASGSCISSVRPVLDHVIIFL